MNKVILLLIFTTFSTSALAANATGNHNGWISMGTPDTYHVGTDGRLIMTGTNKGSCAGVTPVYFQVDLDKPHAKELYAMMLSASSKGASVDCSVSSGCGSDTVVVDYCRAKLSN